MSFRSTLVACIALASLAFSTPASAVPIPVVWGTAEHIIKVMDFPDKEPFDLDGGGFYDAGFKYKVFQIMWLPLWDYDHQWVGYIDDKRYLPMTHDELARAAATAGLTLPSSASPTFWDAWGGKGVALALVLGVFMYRRLR